MLDLQNPASSVKPYVYIKTKTEVRIEYPRNLNFVILSFLRENTIYLQPTTYISGILLYLPSYFEMIFSLISRCIYQPCTIR